MRTYAKTEQPPRSRTYRAALYIRLSREDGDKTESDSVVNQKRLLTNFAQSQPDITSYRYYVDDGWSGANFDRPDFTRMMADVYAQNIDCVIVKDSSRFGRNASESGRYIGEVFPRLRVRYIAVNDAIDSGRSQGVAIDFLNNSMRGMINEYYVAANSESIRSTLDMERRRGDFIGSFAKYGYKKDPANHHKLLVDDESAGVVQEIYRMYLNGSGIRTIVRFLNDSGVPNPSTYKCNQGLNFQSRAIGKSSLWSDKTVRRILQDEMYVGNMVQGRHRKVSYKDKAIIAMPEDEWIRVEGTHEPIIGRDDFDRVQTMLANHAKASAVTGEIGLFSGILRCADCGHALIKKVNNNPNKTYVYYRCSTYCKCRSACSAHTISYEKLYNAVLTLIQTMIAIAVDADEVIRKLKRNQGNSHMDTLKTQLAAQEKKQKELADMMLDLYPDFKRGLLTEEEYLQTRLNYDKQMQAINERIAALKKAMADPALSEHPNEFIKHFKEHQNISELSRPLLTELIESIVVKESGDLEIVFRFRDAFKEAEEVLKESA